MKALTHWSSYNIFLSPQICIISLPLHTFSLHLLSHNVSSSKLNPSPSCLLQDFTPPTTPFYQNLQFFLSSIFLHCCFHFPSLYRYMLVFFFWKKKKCFFYPTLPFSSYNNISSHCSVLHAMAAWPLCAPLSLIRLAGSSSFLLLRLNSVSLSKTFYSLSK